MSPPRRTPPSMNTAKVSWCRLWLAKWDINRPALEKKSLVLTQTYRKSPNKKQVSIVSQSKIWKIVTFSLNNPSAPWWHQPPSRLPWLQATPQAAKLDWTLSTSIQICKGPPYPKPSIYFMKSHPFPHLNARTAGVQLSATMVGQNAACQASLRTIWCSDSTEGGWRKPFNGCPWRPSRHPQRTAHPSTRPGRCGR